MESFPHPIITMGLDADWPSVVTIDTYFVRASHQSPSGDLLVTGGEREQIAVYSVWDIRVAHGETFVHPCNTLRCEVYHVSFSQQDVELWTGCRCGKLCRWNISSNPHSLLEEKQIGTTGTYYWWADDRSKAVSRVRGDDRSKYSYRLSVASNPPVHHTLCEGGLHHGWQFSPGHGDKVLKTFDERTVAVWDCSSGNLIFQKPYKSSYACFSPDGTLIACVCQDVTELISSENGAVLRSWDGIRQPRDVEFFPTGGNFVVFDNSIVHLFDGDARHERRMDCHSISISPDGQKIAAISLYGVDIFNSTLNEKLQCYKFDLEHPWVLHFSWTHSILLSMSLALISFHYLSHIPQSTDPTRILSTISGVFLSPNSDHLLTEHLDDSIHLWDVKSGRHLCSFEDDSIGSSRTVSVKYAPDSSWVTLLTDHQLSALQFSASPLIWIPVIPHSNPKLLAVTFFSDSSRILIVDSDGNVTIFLLGNMSQYSTLTLPSKMGSVRHVVLSPTEHLVVISSNLGLIVKGIAQDTYRIFSRQVEGAGFSPDGFHLYILELSRGKWMISRMDTLSWTVHIIWVGSIGPDRIYLPGLISIFEKDGHSALQVSWSQFSDNEDQFFDLLTGKQIIPLSPRLREYNFLYGDKWIMSMPELDDHVCCMTSDHFAYSKDEKAIVLDYSPLLEQV
jgi:WD40 repeat protein